MLDFAGFMFLITVGQGLSVFRRFVHVACVAVGWVVRGSGLNCRCGLIVCSVNQMLVSFFLVFWAT